MKKQYSDALQKFYELVKNDFKQIKSKKAENEKKDLLYWFVDNCPSQKGPKKAKKFSNYGIENGFQFSQLKCRVLGTLGLKKNFTYKYFQSGKEMESTIEEIEKIYNSKKKQVIFFSKGEGFEMDSLYIRIRNSFAHGNNFKKNDFYYLWNENGPDEGTKKLGSFMVLKYDDLKEIFLALEKS